MTKSDGYTVSQWGVHPMFACEKCPFSTLDEGRMREHVAECDHELRYPQSDGGIGNFRAEGKE